MKARLPSCMQPPKKFVTESQIRHEIQHQLDEEYKEGQRAQRDVDLLATNRVFKAGKIRIERFNEVANEIIAECNVYGTDDHADGMRIARDKVRQALAQLGVTIED